ncbi:hypothetical protein J2Z32_001936 [Paenibacillus turicensis]|uniref:Uncharacterized protein n=1 Tax=Paenibacillus turicensis TaxID=160487 RepID=A0ABS4FSK2_9BACL|nr:hypothetical protein [Paenibacillus turicensis]
MKVNKKWFAKPLELRIKELKAVSENNKKQGYVYVGK